MQIYLPIAELPISIFLVLGLSGAVGFISGLFGVGGGFLLTPLLIFLDIPPAVAVATVAAQVAGSSMTGVLTYWRRNALDFKLGGILVSGGIFGTVLGVLFFNSMRRLGQLELVITVAYVTLFTCIGGLMLFDAVRAALRDRSGKPARRLREAGSHPPWMGLPLRMRFPRSQLYASVIPIAALAVIIGFIGAVLGVGGGFMLVPALIYFFRIPPAVVVGTSLFQILVTMTGATVLHAVTNQSVDIILAMLLLVGGVIGAQFGGRAARNLNVSSFRLLLALLILSVGLRFAVELFLPPSEPYSVVVTEGAQR
ncbi:sulfite exporter TauE/SafE family protein [Bosea sp. (in: a-proteobacteria)]|uniref:sulfite exporter TauE/SafE family protein n=1 Tax=Bosea sp. (in: a-proteobacteria) TaxID=1871050 RepID=UPI002DDDA5F4|nr:sulfite exporter TauE/SafE family protein [Bosea sp. (in: a-proteobacteria)]HEV2509196.1 sulfite exporter TauE/SafE family protein [Bosea sp. (in: a-proteobacteria)]